MVSRNSRGENRQRWRVLQIEVRRFTIGSLVSVLPLISTTFNMADMPLAFTCMFCCVKLFLLLFLCFVCTVQGDYELFGSLLRVEMRCFAFELT